MMFELSDGRLGQVYLYHEDLPKSVSQARLTHSSRSCAAVRAMQAVAYTQRTAQEKNALLALALQLFGSRHESAAPPKSAVGLPHRGRPLEHDGLQRSGKGLDRAPPALHCQEHRQWP